MLTIKKTTKFKKDFKTAVRRGCDISVFEYVVTELANERRLDEKYKDHALTGNYIGFRECHLAPDWLLVYQVDKGQLILTLSRTGTHSDLFE
ncbi:MAG: type II toxin-antitoxin system YafQ family toxin [Clostridia bacterium]|nr:type II toxin-antitoxin system YafQ family toxin [Clostridia bacterium]MBP3292747.1 type II toxin-antitoxin system YafQ family toxin [Clostridia bacterium]MBQ7312709.1 type II toxin-antitoxin system YafQ family toxin [Clostridia bacterium]